VFVHTEVLVFVLCVSVLKDVFVFHCTQYLYCSVCASEEEEKVGDDDDVTV
jgi:hypothetical protein